MAKTLVALCLAVALATAWVQVDAARTGHLLVPAAAAADKALLSAADMAGAALETAAPPALRRMLDDGEDDDGEDDGDDDGGDDDNGGGSPDDEDGDGKSNEQDDDDDGDGTPDDDDEDNYVRDPKLTVAGIQDCKRALDALTIDYNGATVFCPRNSGMLWLAKYLGLASTDALIADLASPASATRPTVESYFKFLVSPGNVIPLSSIALGASSLDTLLTPDDAAAVISLVKEDRSRPGGVTMYEVKLAFKAQAAEVQAFDLTFAADYAAGDAYVVHALDDPLTPDNTYTSPAALFKAQKAVLSTSSKLFGPAIAAAAKASSTTAKGPTTLFLPSNAAWDQLAAQSYAQPKALSVKSVQKSKALKDKLMSYSSVPGMVPYSKRQNKAKPFSAAGKPTVAGDATITGGISALNKGKIVGTFRAGKFIVNVVDTVVLPNDV